MSGADHHRIAKPKLADYLAVMSRAIFQAGVSWAQIDRQWAALCDAFDGFDPQAVASYDEQDVRRIIAHPGILHSERKVKAIIRNAQTMLALDHEHGGFARYLRSFKNYRAAAADIQARFAYVGDISAYYFLFRAGEPVPSFDAWIKTVEGDHPRVREMVTGAQARVRNKRRSAPSNRPRGR